MQGRRYRIYRKEHVMRSLVMKCLALGMVSMGLWFGTAHAQQVPPELRAELQRLQAREQALLKARNLCLELLEDHENLLIQVDIGAGFTLPLAVPRASLTTEAILGAIYRGSAQQHVQGLLLFDRAVRQDIQQRRIPEIDTKLAEVRSEFDKLTAQARGQTSPVKSTAAWGPGTSNGVPMDGGHRVDTCLVWGGWCDQIAADYFCEQRGFGKALKVERETINLAIESSITLKSREVCSTAHHPPSGCGAFKSITCGPKK
jgi:hypothetical protein